MAESRLPVASSVLRDETISALQEHYAQGNVEMPDFEARVERAENARTDNELTLCLDGLPALVRTAPLVPVDGPPVALVSATLGATTRRGRWRVPARVKLRAFLGSVEVDLCEAELGPGETVVEVQALLGSITITVPEGLAVDCEGSAFMGSFDHLAQGAANRWDGRVVRIMGSARFGSVDVVVRPKSGVINGIKALLTGK